MSTNDRIHDQVRQYYGEALRGSADLRNELKDMVREQGLETRVRVFQSGCLGG